MNFAVATIMMNATKTHRSTVSTYRAPAKKVEQGEPKTHALYEVCKGKAGKTVLATYKANKAAEKKAAELGGHVVVRFVSLTEYKATESSAKK